MHKTISSRTAFLIITAVGLLLVLLIILGLAKQYDDVTQKSSKVVIPTVSTVKDIPTNVDETVLNAVAVDTCMKPIMDKQPDLTITVPAQRTKANMDQYRYNVRRANIAANAWLKEYEAGLKKCYNDQLAQVEGASSSAYTQKSWK